MKDNIIQKKSFEFAIRVVNAYKYLQTEKKEFVLSKQFLRSGTSIGANVEEAIGGQSKKDFISKISIAYKEARETKYWLKLYQSSNLIQIEVDSYLKEIESIINILTKIIKTSSENL